MTKNEICEQLFAKNLNSKLFAIVDCGHYIEMQAAREFPFEDYGNRILWIGDATDLIKNLNRTIFWYEERKIRPLIEEMLCLY